MKRYNGLLILIPVLLILFLIWYKILYYGYNMEEKGNKIIGKIECYIKQNGTPPDSLLEVGINDCDDFYPFYYEKKDVAILS